MKSGGNGGAGSLVRFVDSIYFPERDLRASTRLFVKMKVEAFARFLGRAPELSDLTAATVNRYLDARLEERSRETVRGERSVLVALWNAAYMAHDVDAPPLRVKRIKRLPRPVDAWDEGQIEKLLAVAAKQSGAIRSSRVVKAAFWRAVVSVLYDTGLRLGDLLALESDQLRGPGSLVVVQAKTSKPVEVTISPESWDALVSIDFRKRRRPFGDVLRRRAFGQGFARLCKLAGLDGRTKMLRRASGSLVDAINGRGHEHLGNTRQVFDRNYRVARLAKAAALLPPRLRGLAAPPARS